jgi:hypothetical protein
MSFTSLTEFWPEAFPQQDDVFGVVEFPAGTWPSSPDIDMDAFGELDDDGWNNYDDRRGNDWYPFVQNQMPPVHTISPITAYLDDDGRQDVDTPRARGRSRKSTPTVQSQTTTMAAPPTLAVPIPKYLTPIQEERSIKVQAPAAPKSLSGYKFRSSISKLSSQKKLVAEFIPPTRARNGSLLDVMARRNEDDDERDVAAESPRMLHSTPPHIDNLDNMSLLSSVQKLKQSCGKDQDDDFCVMDEFGDSNANQSSLVYGAIESKLARALDFGDTPEKNQTGGLDYVYGQRPALDSRDSAGRLALGSTTNTGATRNTKLALDRHTKVVIDGTNQGNVGEVREVKNQHGNAPVANPEHTRRSSVGGEIVADRRQWLLDAFKGKEKDCDYLPSTCASTIPPTKIDKKTIAMFGGPAKAKSSVQLRREEYERKLNEMKAAAAAPKLRVKTQWDQKVNKSYRKSVVVKTTE